MLLISIPQCYKLNIIFKLDEKQDVNYVTLSIKIQCIATLGNITSQTSDFAAPHQLRDCLGKLLNGKTTNHLPRRFE